MKKYLFTLAAIVATLVSCNKVDSEKPETSGQKENSFSVEKTFSVIVPETKTELGSDGLSMIWSSTDKINIIAGTSGNQYTFDLSSGAGTASASFSGTIDAEDAAETVFYAVYPDVNVSVSSSTIEFLGSSVSGHPKYYNTGETVKAIAGSFDPEFAPMTAVTGENDELSFRYGCAFFKFKVAEEGITSIEFSTDGNGRVDGRPKFATATGINSGVESAQKSITIAPESGSFDVSATYYLPVLTKQSTFGKLTLKYTADNGNSKSISMTAFSNVTLTAGKIYNLGTPPISFSTEPMLTIKKATIDNVTAAETIGLSESEAYLVENCTDNDVDVTFDGTVVTAASISGGTVTYSVSANDGDARQGWIGLQLTGGEVQTIIVNQVAVGTATELVPITTTTTWNEDNWAAMKEQKGTSAIKEDLLFDNIQFIDGNGSGIKFNNNYAQLAGSGSATKCCLQFKVASAGSVEITCKSGNSNNDRTLKVAFGSSVTDVSAPGASENTASVAIDSAGTVIIYSGGSGINIFTIKWTPSE